MSREQRTRLNIMISEQTGAAPATPGRTSRVDELDEDADADAVEAQDAVEEQVATPAAPRRSVFDAPFAADQAREAAPDDDREHESDPSPDDVTLRRG